MFSYGGAQQVVIVRITFVLTVVVSGFLLFLLQPIIAKRILPWFGGTTSVWTGCIFFFQVVLLAGYAYAHLSIRALSPRMQMVVHLSLLLVAICFLPVSPSPTWKPESLDQPTTQILWLLVATAGLPYLLLASTAPLIQAWHGHMFPDSSTYRLYAFSNLAAILALLAYPFALEPALSIKTQELGWSWCFGFFVLTSAACAVSQFRTPSEREAFRESGADVDVAELPAPSHIERLLWLALPAGSSVLLLAVTNYVCLDIAVVPFLWVIPLALYLLTFAICFAHDRCYPTTIFRFALGFAVAAICLVLHEPFPISLTAKISMFMCALAVCCMFLHGELARLKPSTPYLTAYYLALSLGGAIGGAFVSWIAPLIFDAYFELHVGLVFVVLIAVAISIRRSVLEGIKLRPTWIWALVILGMLFLVETLRRHARNTLGSPQYISRNFFGVIRVLEQAPESPENHRLVIQQNGVTQGFQFQVGQQRSVPTCYYGPQSGVGRAIAALQQKRPLKIGALGVGVGTIAAYGRDGDTIRFYEINPKIVALATADFSYLADSRADIDIIMGDARLSLEREVSQKFDLLVVDVFQGDAIPVHLLTAEAFETYLRHLTPDGILAIHLSNLNLDLVPVAWKLSEHYDIGMQWVWDQAFSPTPLYQWSEWVLLSYDSTLLSHPQIRRVAARLDSTLERKKRHYENLRLWTDDYSNLLQVLAQ